MSGASLRFISACCSSASKSEYARSPLTSVVAPRDRAYSTVSPVKLATSTLSRPLSDVEMRCMRSSTLKRQPLFSVEERMQLISTSLKGRERVEVASFTGLTVEYARSRGATTLVKGLRAYSDFDAELQQALMNRKLAPDIHTVFLMSGFAHIFVS